MQDGISIILLAYMEENNLKTLLPLIIENINKTSEKYEIIVVDTEKPIDHTEDVCKKYGVKYVNQKYDGFGGALRTGIENASMDRIMTLDSDGAHDPCYIPRMVQLFNSGKYDVTIGSRYVKGGGTADPWMNVFMSKILNNTYRIFFNLGAKDLSTNFRMYFRKDIIDLSLECINYDVLQEILIKLKLEKNGNIKIGEFPIVLKKRISGKSKRKLFVFIRSYLETLFVLKKVETEYRGIKH